MHVSLSWERQQQSSYYSYHFYASRNILLDCAKIQGEKEQQSTHECAPVCPLALTVLVPLMLVLNVPLSGFTVMMWQTQLASIV